jgi:23S rRNA (cytosine1962-C5)-methyltransferase
MFASDPYQLLDFAAGRKLECFGSRVVDRPAPGARGAARRHPELWSQAAARYDRIDGERGQWTGPCEFDAKWSMSWGPITLELKLTEFGQLGVFPEQADNWDWIAAQVRAAGRAINVLNLFAYSGASTLAAAAAGAEVTHVDAAGGIVAWARRNAVRSGLAQAPIRWITDDAMKFARRELKRGRRYDAVILDPPSYGHGPRGESWKLDEHLDELLSLCWELTADTRQFMLLSCHSGELAFGEPLLERSLAQNPELRELGTVTGDDMTLRSSSGERLHCGATVRWSRHAPRDRSQARKRATARSGDE